MNAILLAAGGILNSALAIFHLMFWKNPGFNWKEELPKLNMLNRGVMQVTNIMLVYVLTCFTVISFLLLSLQSIGTVEKTVIILIGGFYLFRAVLQYPFFEMSRIGAGLFVVCLLISGCYFGILL